MSELIANGDLPKPIHVGAYDLIASMRAYVTFLRSNHNNLSAERTRLTKARADRVELENRVRGKELIEVATVKQIMFERGRQVCDAVLSTPDRLTGMLAAEHDQTKINSQLTRELHQALEALTS